MPALAKSAKLIAAEKKLEELEAQISADRKRREAELVAALDQARRDAEAIRQAKLASIRPLPHTTPSTPIINPKPSPIQNLPNPTVPVPVALGPGSARAAKDLPESALLLLRELWANLGYEGHGFVEMQMEIARELERADFARFEREMLCNEVISCKTEINMLREERSQLLRRLDLNRENINQLMTTEERTYKTLIAEREASQVTMARFEQEAKEAIAARDVALGQAAMLQADLERAEKARIAAVLYAKGAEDRATTAACAAAAAAEVATRRATAPPTPALPIYWSVADDEALKTKLQERKLAVQEEKLLAEGKRLDEQLAKVKDEKEKLVSKFIFKNPNSRFTSLKDMKN
ncbi:uncharacterized protein MELLADRAFT_67790 [Melampsora larici-populina 98AG31]|uniref:Uncharacterized protein n=1 Tax=Melampsora larici-populina (strain 98AG31 / pathotype 3-4-7) TaxID=747676 RepID=F4S4F4_MELLP|nr:uncharacterized protein MELLADRAFT_67790 [Melampsora larici-populina 98AG31]EGG00477.1 hypothetical protein MELLADRAFT_67790 [Melampsora larici-populina 98AG31]